MSNGLLDLGYVYNGIFGIDLGYGYSLNDKKDMSIALIQRKKGQSTSEDENFNFVENFRSENADVGDKTFSFGLTYYINEKPNTCLKLKSPY